MGTTTVILIVSAVIISLLLLGYLRLLRRIRASEATTAQLKDRIDVQELIDEEEPAPPQRPHLRVIRGGRGVVLAPLVWLLERARAHPVPTAATASTAGLVTAAVVFWPSETIQHPHWAPPAVVPVSVPDVGLPHVPDQDVVVDLHQPDPEPEEADRPEDANPPSDPPTLSRPRGFDTEESAPDESAQESPEQDPETTQDDPERPDDPETDQGPVESENPPDTESECLVDVIIDNRVVQIDICVNPPPDLPLP